MRRNCYGIHEFIKIYQKYDFLEILYNTVSVNQAGVIEQTNNQAVVCESSYGQVSLILCATKKLMDEVEMKIRCTKVRYTFTN